MTCVERGGMQPPSQRSARFAVETRWKKTCVVERPALFWIGSSQGLYNFKLGKEIILYLVLHFANPACFRSHKDFRCSVLTHFLQSKWLSESLSQRQNIKEIDQRPK